MAPDAIDGPPLRPLTVVKLGLSDPPQVGDEVWFVYDDDPNTVYIATVYAVYLDPETGRRIPFIHFDPEQYFDEIEQLSEEESREILDELRQSAAEAPKEFLRTTRC